jgi:hypothetical protein
MIEVAMKATDRILRLYPVFACLLFAMAAMSCQTNTKPSMERVQQPVTRKNWVMVSSQPPTYYPTGVAPDIPTDHRSGEWVYTDDERGSRYFIPLHGLGTTLRQDLVEEALAARSDRKMEQIAAEDEEILVKNVRNMVLFGPPTYAGLLLAAMGGGAPDEIDIHRLQKEWDTLKQPH